MGLHLTPGAISPSNCSSRSVVLSMHILLQPRCTGLAPRHVTEQTTCHPMCSDTRQPTQPRAIPTAENPAASGCTPDGNHTTVKGTLQKSKIVSPDLGQHRGGLLTTKGNVNSPVVGQRPCQVTMVGKGNGHLAPRFPPTRQPIPPHNDPQLCLALPGVLEVRNNGIKGKYIFPYLGLVLRDPCGLGNPFLPQKTGEDI